MTETRSVHMRVRSRAPRAAATATALACALATWAGLPLGPLSATASAQAAATITVNTTADSSPAGNECAGAPGDCSLRRALDRAVSGDLVVVPANAAPYAVTHEKIPVRGGVTIEGAGAGSTVISGEGVDQVFNLLGNPSVTIRDLTITRAYNDSGEDEGGAINGEAVGGDDLVLEGVTVSESSSPTGFGGALETGSHVWIRHSRFVEDSASTPGTKGGGGAIDLFVGGTLEIADSVFEGNSLPDGGGGAVLVEKEGHLTVTASTFSENIAGGGAPGGALELGRLVTANITNSTFTANAAGTGGAIYQEGAHSVLTNDTFAGNGAEIGANIALVGVATAIAQNTIFAYPAGGGHNCYGKVTSAGHNLDDTSPSTCGLSSANDDETGSNPMLSPLAVNGSIDETAGGPPRTLALAPESRAIGAGDTSACSSIGAVDERGFPRPGAPSLGCDIGAYELLATVATTSALTASGASQTLGTTLTLVARVTALRALPAAVPAPGGSVDFFDGPTAIGTAPVAADGTATLRTTALAVGLHSLSASYAGDALYGASNAGAVAVTVTEPMPLLSALRESHRRWRGGAALARVSRPRRVPRGTRFSFSLNTAATVVLTFAAPLRGRLLGGRCVRRAERARAGAPRPCTLLQPEGTLSFAAVEPGMMSISFDGRLARSRRLRPGHYVLFASARNGRGASRALAIGFTIVGG